MDGTVLIADDDRTIRTVLTQALTRAGCNVHATSSLTTLMRWISEGKGDTVITDVMMPDGNGIEMLPKIAQDRPGLPVIVISAQNTIMTAIQANEAKAFDYLPKPFDLPDLMTRVGKALQSRRTLSRSGTEQGTDGAGDGALPLVGTTPIMQELYRTIARIMNSDLPILVSGESGAGKSLIAKLLHNFSDRRNLPFVSVGADDLTDLDGPAKVLARAKGGTIVFEEIGDFPTNVQARIVTMIDNSGEHAPRFIGTLQGDVPSALSDGLVRDDLYYRIAGATIDAPSLRERVEDIALLADHFLAKLDRDGASTGRLSDDALDLMRKYVWPGNVRQLENIVRRLGLTAQETSISKAEVEAALRMQPEADKLPHRGGEKLSADVERHLRRYFELHGGELPPPGLHARVLREVEAPMIEIALDATGGNQAKCADLLGINRNTLRKKINELDIKVTRRRKLM